MKPQALNHYKQIVELLEELGDSHGHLAELFAICPDPGHTDGDKALAEAEQRSAETYRRVAAAIRSRFVAKP